MPKSESTRVAIGISSGDNGPEMDKPLEIQNVVVYRTWRAVIGAVPRRPSANARAEQTPNYYYIAELADKVRGAVGGRVDLAVKQ